MSEQVSSHGRYPRRVTVTVEGREVEVYDTNNLLSYLETVVKMRDRAEGDPAVSPSKSVVEDVFERGWDIKKYFDEFIDNPDDFHQKSVALVRERYRLRDAVYDGTQESADAWKEWNDRIGFQDAFKVLQSEMFERMAPSVEADGREPIELTI